MSVNDVDASTKKISVAGGQVVITPRNLGDYIVPAGIDKLTANIGLSVAFKVA